MQLGLIMEPLLTTFTSTVSSASLDELRRTAFLWIDQHCSMIDLRPGISLILFKQTTFDIHLYHIFITSLFFWFNFIYVIEFFN